MVQLRDQVVLQKNQQFLIHHLLSLALTISPYPQMYPDITSKLLVVERTIPIANAIWFLKYYKLGYGCVTDQVCEAIHQGKINRNEAIDLVNKYDGVCDLKYIKSFCKYLDISLSQFWEVLDKFVNKDLFEKHDGKWKPKFKVG